MSETIKRIPFQIEKNNMQKTETLVVHLTSVPAQSDQQAVHIIQLKNDEVYDFLYFCEITENGFEKIRKENSIHLKHNEFPSWFFSKLDQTNKDHNVILKIEENISENHLEIIHTTQSQSLKIFQMAIYNANDETKNNYMKGQIKEWKEKTEKLTEKLLYAEKSLIEMEVFFFLFLL
jgi:hypothetical protein